MGRFDRENRKKIFCNKCKEMIAIVTLDHGCNPFAGEYIIVSQTRNNADYTLPTLPDGYVYEWNLYYHLKCWEGEFPPMFPKQVKLEEKDKKAP